MDQTGLIASAVTDGDGTAAADVRAFAGEEDYEACVTLQRRVWGETYTCVPSALLKVAQRVGAVAAGAFDEAGAMLGFVFGLTGVEDGTLVHWSHMLAVEPASRDRGIGTLLKRHQVERVRALGAERIDWTFDPLVARNAHLNVNRFGVEVRAYAPDMYSGTGSDLHVFGTDRLIVSLPVSRRRAARAQPPEEAAADAPFLNPRRGASALDARALRASCVRIRIPADITAIAAADPPAARAWRNTTRAAFTRALADGFAIVRLRSEIDGDCSYVLWRDA